MGIFATNDSLCLGCPRCFHLQFVSCLWSCKRPTVCAGSHICCSQFSKCGGVPAVSRSIFEVHYVLYLRSRHHLSAPSHSDRLRNGETCSAHEKSHRKEPYDSGGAAYPISVQKLWKSIFGRQVAVWRLGSLIKEWLGCFWMDPCCTKTRRILRGSHKNSAEGSGNYTINYYSFAVCPNNHPRASQLVQKVLLLPWCKIFAFSWSRITPDSFCS